MFQRWGFLLGEMWGLLLLAALLGLFAGWLIWGRYSATATASTGEADSLRAALDSCNAKGRDQAGRIATLEGDLAKARAAAATTNAAQPPVAAALMSAPAVSQAASPPAPTPAPIPKAAPKSAASPKADPAAKGDPTRVAKPKGLDTARAGKPDDLKLIKGIGPKLEMLCHKLGFFHFDQIAAWTVGEIAWVDDNLAGFKGRVTRDEWVQQAKTLAKGGTTEFANRVKDGDVY